MKNKYWLLTIALVWLTGCATHTSDKGNGLVLHPENMDFVLEDTAFFRSSLVIPLETTDESVIRKIAGVCMAGDTLFLFDRFLGKVFLFDKKGNYIKSIHRVGEGPGEYLQIMDIGIDTQQKRLLLFCDRPYKMMYYDYSGNFIGEKSYPNYYAEIAYHNGLISCLRNESKERICLHLYDCDLNKMAEYDFSGCKFFASKDANTTLAFSNGRRLTASADYVSFTLPYDNVIYHVGKDTVEERHAIDFQEYQMPDDLLGRYLSPSEFLQLCEEKSYLYTLENVVETEHSLLCATNRGILAYNKQESALSGYMFIENTDLKFMKAGYMPVNGTNWIAQSYLSNELKRYIDNLVAQNAEIPSCCLHLSERLTDESNPVLVLYEVP